MAAAREDRFSRRPGDSGFPRNAAAYCLRAAKIGPGALEAIVFPGPANHPADDEGGSGPIGGSLLRRLARIGRRETIADLVARDLDPAVPFEGIDPERAHLAAAYHASPFREAAILVARSTGEITIGRGRDGVFEALESPSAPGRGLDPEALADFLLASARRAREIAGCTALVLGGEAVADRRVVGRVLRADGHAELWVQPAAAVGATALGAALDRWHRTSRSGRSGASTRDPADDEPRALPTPGPAYNAHQVRTFLRSRELCPEETPREESAGRVASRLRDGQRVAWFEGRLDFGDDTTASRSILAPASTGHADDAVLALPLERVPELLELERASLPPLADAIVRPAWRERLGLAPDRDRPVAVFAADPTRRVFRSVLAAVERETDVPAVWAQPLSRDGEPVACTPADAFAVWESLGLDALVMQTYEVGAREPAPQSR